ncbi:MAG: DMT family transporter [Actinomycetota bacterium]
MNRLTKLARDLRVESLLVLAALIWGLTFVVVKDAIERVPPFSFLAWRFLLAAAALMILRPRCLRGLTKEAWKAGGWLTLALYAGYAFQTIGLQYTTASNSAFITGLFVVLVPLIAALVLRRVPSPAALGGVVLATAGLALLSLGPSLRLAKGDTLMLGCAVAFAVHILLLGAYAPRFGAYPLVVMQLAGSGLLHAVSATAGRDSLAFPLEWKLAGAVALCGLLASAGAFLIQVRAQETIPPTRTAVILTMEPVFAGVFGYLLAGEVLTGRGWTGSGLILAGMLVAELLAPEREAT